MNAVSVQNLILPAGDQKIGKFDWNVALNASPAVLDKINDLPVKKVNGTVIYIRDVAFVHQGSPPQTNMVRVNGPSAVLMTILKAGSPSTLDVIDGVKSLLPRSRRPCPPASICTPWATNRFLSRPRSSACFRRRCWPRAGRLDDPAVPRQLALDDVILVEIPLAILFSLTALSSLGETINVMTLGGLALAVGMLVDQGMSRLKTFSITLSRARRSSRRSWTAPTRTSFRPS